MNLQISPPVKPETQTKRIQLYITPTLKEVLTKVAGQYDTSVNSLIVQLLTAGLRALEEQQPEEGE
jgi:predicted HicB family RNase H-like nuclease